MQSSFHEGYQISGFLYLIFLLFQPSVYCPIYMYYMIVHMSILQDSLTVLPYAYVDNFVKDAKVYEKFQFERTGFFSVDPDSTKNKVGDVLILLI